MAGGLGNYYSEMVLNALLGNVAMTIPGTWYAALFSVTPSDFAAGTELALANGYARIAITNNTTNFPNSTVVSNVATLTNGTSITWGPASGSNWTAAVAVGFFDASTSGNLGPWGPLATGVTVLVGQSLVITATNGVFTES